MLPVGFGLQWWTVVVPLVLIGIVAAFYFTRREAAVMAMGRLAAFGLLLMVINGPWGWNLALGIAALLLIVDIYRREGRSQFARIVLGVLRAAAGGGWFCFCSTGPTSSMSPPRSSPRSSPC